MPSALESVNFSFIRILAGLQHGVFVLALEDPVCHRVHCDVVRGRKRQKNGGACSHFQPALYAQLPASYCNFAMLSLVCISSEWLAWPFVPRS